MVALLMWLGREKNEPQCCITIRIVLYLISIGVESKWMQSLLQQMLQAAFRLLWWEAISDRRLSLKWLPNSFLIQETLEICWRAIWRGTMQSGTRSYHDFKLCKLVPQAAQQFLYQASFFLLLVCYFCCLSMCKFQVLIVQSKNQRIQNSLWKHVRRNSSAYK